MRMSVTLEIFLIFSNDMITCFSLPFCILEHIWNVKSHTCRISRESGLDIFLVYSLVRSYTKGRLIAIQQFHAAAKGN